MSRKSLIALTLVAVLALLALAACGGKATEQPTTAPATTPPPATMAPQPTEAPKATEASQTAEAPATSGDFNTTLDKAMDAAKAGDADKALAELNEALDLAESDADKAFVNELIEDAEKGALDEVAEDINTFLSAGAAPSFESVLDEAMDAAKVGDADKALAELNEALDLASSEPDTAFVQELLGDVKKGNLDEVAEDIETYLSSAESTGVNEEEAKLGRELYIKQGCFACHGNSFEGNLGPIIVGMPVKKIRFAVRHGFPHAEPPMPAFSPEQLSDKDLDVLARYINSLTIRDTGLKFPPDVTKHLELALEAATSGDKAATEKHIQAAYDAAPEEDFEGLRVSLHDLLEDMEEKGEGLDKVQFHLEILLGK